jgi:hypothetical protein
LTTADIEVSQGKILNMQSIKALTDNDMSDGGARVNITVASIMNKLYYPLDIKDQARADITRRVAVLELSGIRKMWMYYP